MPKFMSTHTVGPNTMKREQVDQIAQAAQKDGTIKPYRSFINLAEGQLMCVMEAPTKDALAAWFKKMNVPCNSISAVELEGDCGVVQEAR